MPKNALIIGISGQDGTYLADFLLKKGYNVAGTSRDALASSFHNLEELGIKEKVRLYSMSLNDFRSTLQVLKDVEPEEIYNLGGQTSVGLSFDQPVETFESIGTGTLNLLESIRFLEAPIKLYNASSSECFGNTNGIAANESTPFSPQSPYGFAKAAAFWAVANYRDAYDIFACSGLLFNHESPIRPERFVTRKIVKAACNIHLGKQTSFSLGNMEIQRDWGWSPEYVQAMWMMLHLDKAKDFVIATGQTRSLKDFTEAVFACLDLDYRDYLEHNPSLLRPSDILISRADTKKAREELGWQAKYKMADVAAMMVEHELKRLKESTC